jgi:hypothetical protein
VLFLAGGRRFSTDRRRRRRLVAGLLVAALLLGVYLFSLGAAYQVGLSQTRSEVERLMQDLGTERDANAALQERLAVAERDAVRARELRAQLERRAANVRELTPETLPILDLVNARLAEGMAPERLALFIRTASRERTCDPDPETKRILLRTELERQGTSATFANGRFTVQGSGIGARDGQGRLEAWYDPEQPVELTISGEGANGLAGLLPLERSIVSGRRQYLFQIRNSSRRGFAEVTMRACDYP